MYEVDSLDRVRELHDLPACDTGAPLPVVLTSEQDVLVVYLLPDAGPSWDGRSVQVVGGATAGMPIAIVRFIHCVATMFGPPNDEAFSGHPLAARGLMPYGCFEVEQSSWARGLEKMNRVHPRHRPESFADYRHFIVTFHDSTFECIAQRAEVALRMTGSLQDAVATAASMLKVC